MDKHEFRKKWVEALRSGQYKQGKALLRNGDEFCCLGVACDLYSKLSDTPLVVEPGYTFDGDASSYRYGNEGHSTCLPSELVIALDISDRFGRIDANAKFPHRDVFLEKSGYASPGLTAMNDTGMTFEQIADVIESNPKGLFKE